jgi:hypothetical protein
MSEDFNPQNEIDKTVGTVGWNFIKERLEAKFRELDKISDIDTSQPAENVKLEVMKRQHLITGIEEEINSLLLEVEESRRKKIDYS